MPTKPLSPCPHPQCGALTHGGRCPAHEKTRHTQVDSRRGNSYQRGYGNEWRALRAEHLRRNPLCVVCRAGGRIEVATHVDHIIPHRGNRDLLLDPTNLRSLCAHHDSQGTVMYDGGFGKAVRPKPA